MTDHKNLTYFSTKVQKSERQLRWSQYIQGFNFNLHYTKGSSNVAADFLSRPDDESKREKTIDYIFPPAINQLTVTALSEDTEFATQAKEAQQKAIKKKKKKKET